MLPTNTRMDNMAIEHIGNIVNKEKKQKKNNKTKGQFDKLLKYDTDDELSTGKSTTDKLIRREAKYLKNIHIDQCYEKLRQSQLINDDADAKWRDWYFKALHQLGTSFVMAQAARAQAGRNPAALFHFLLNKGMNVKKDPYAPRL